MEWAKEVEGPSRLAGVSAPRLEIIPSPYRQVVTPLGDYINKLKDEYPTRLIAVIIPKLVETRWYEFILHNHRATWLKTDLLLKGDQRVVVISEHKPGTPAPIFTPLSGGGTRNKCRDDNRSNCEMRDNIVRHGGEVHTYSFGKTSVSCS